MMHQFVIENLCPKYLRKFYVDQYRLYFVKCGNGDRLEALSLSNYNSVREYYCEDLEYYTLLDNGTILLNDSKRKRLVLLDSETFRIIDNMPGHYLCGEDVRIGNTLIATEIVQGVKTTVRLEVNGERIHKAVLQLPRKPDLIVDHSYVLISGSLIRFFNNNNLIWTQDIQHIFPGFVVAMKSFWALGDLLVVMARNGDEKIVLWFDVGSGKLINSLKAGWGSVDKINETLVWFRSPIDDGTLNFLSLREGTVHTIQLKEMLMSLGANFTIATDAYFYRQEGHNLFIAHIYNKCITIFDMGEDKLVDHFKVESPAAALFDLSIGDKQLFVLDNEHRLQIFLKS